MRLRLQDILIGGSFLNFDLMVPEIHAGNEPLDQDILNKDFHHPLFRVVLFVMLLMIHCTSYLENH
jgi:hypothetical protein